MTIKTILRCAIVVHDNVSFLFCIYLPFRVKHVLLACIPRDSFYGNTSKILKMVRYAIVDPRLYRKNHLDNIPHGNVYIL